MTKTYKAFGENIETTIDFSGILPETNELATIQIIEKVISQTTTRKTKIWRKGVNACFLSQPMPHLTNPNYLLLWDGIAAYETPNASTLYYQNLGCDEGTLRIFTLSEAFGLLLWQKGTFLLHGSAVLNNGFAHVFVGVPGAGKSTTATAFWKAGNIILSDDLVAIQLINNQAYVIPAFPQLKVWKNGLEGLGISAVGLAPSFEGVEKYVVQQDFSTFPQKPIPLKRITFLQKPRSTKPNGTISPLQAPIELVKHFPLPTALLKDAYLKTHFLESLQLAKSVELLNLRRPKNFTALTHFVENYE